MVLALINALGLISGVLINETVMYVLCGISFVAFSHKYALIAWDIIYEKESFLVGLDGKINMEITNELVCFFGLLCIYWLIAQKAGALCVSISILQCMIMGLFDFIRKVNKSELVIGIFGIELLISIAYL